MNRKKLFEKLSQDFEQMRIREEISQEDFIASGFGAHESIIEWTIQKIIEYRAVAILGDSCSLDEGDKINDVVALAGLILCESFLNRDESVSVSKIDIGE
jgi:hypothetical protein